MNQTASLAPDPKSPFATPQPLAPTETGEHRIVGNFESILVEGEVVLAFPAGRHARLMAAPSVVSVIVPVFNGGSNLERCLESIVLQAFTDYTVAIVDNGSTDGSLVLACEFALRNPTAVVYQNPRNIGRIPNWNRALTLARGRYVKPVMVNDFLAPECLGELVAALERNPGAAFARASLSIMRANGELRFLPLFDTAKVFGGAEAIRYSVLKGNIAAGPSAQMYRRSVIKTLELRYDEALSWAADFDFTLRLLAAGDMAYVRKPLYVFDEGAQRHFSTSGLQNQLAEELEVRKRCVLRNPATFPSPLEPIARCREILQEYASRMTDPGVVQAMTGRLREVETALLGPKSSTGQETSSTDPVETGTDAADYAGYLELPNGPEVEPGQPRQICIVSNGLIGPTRTGGVATWVTRLAETLVEAGHRVTVVLARWFPPDDQTFEYWIGHYRLRNIDLVVLDCQPAVTFHGANYLIATREVYEWLKKSRFDLVHFNDYEGLGYYTLLAKHQGIAFHDTRLCVTVHSPHFYLKQAGYEFVSQVRDLEIDFMERQSVALADVVISPSRFMLDWMKRHDWVLPARCYVQQSMIPRSTFAGGGARGPAGPVAGGSPVHEIVFFGLLQDIKGVPLFCDALDKLAERSRPGLSVVFLGKEGVVQGLPSRDYIERRAKSWNFPWKIVSNLGPDDAIEYLSGPGRIAVMASILDNSPYAVMECIEHRIPFLAARVGGVAELIHPDDLDRVCYERSAPGLLVRLEAALAGGHAPVRHRVPGRARRKSWLGFYSTLPRTTAVPVRPPDPDSAAGGPLVTVCITHFNRPTYLRQAVASIAAQTYANCELVIVDDGSSQPEAVAYLVELEEKARRENLPWRVIRQANKYLGAARNNGVRHARGEFVAFLDDDDIAKPERIALQVAVARHTGADIVLAGIDEFAGGDAPSKTTVPRATWIALGPAVAVGAFKNTFGAVQGLVRKDAFLKLGGFRELWKLGHEDWEFWARAVTAGLRLEMVPEPLNWYRITPNSMLQTTAPYPNFMVSLQPYLDATPRELRPIVQMAFGMAQDQTKFIAYHANLRDQRSGLYKKIVDAAKWIALQKHDEAKNLVIEATQLAAKLNDGPLMYEIVFDGGLILAGTQAHHAAGMELLKLARQLAGTIKYAAGVERVDSMVRALAGQGPNGNHKKTGNKVYDRQRR